MFGRASSLTCVLGHPRVLDEGAPDAHRRVVEHRDGRLAGAAAYEPLYGPAAEIAVAVERPDDRGLVRSLVAAVAARARDAGLHAVNIAVQPGQEPTVAAVLGVPVIDGLASLRLDGADDSVLHTDGDAQRVPMTRLEAAPILDP